MNNRNITGTGNISINGTVTAAQFVGVRVSTDTAPSLGGNLNLNSKNITGTGNINITGNIVVTTGLTAGSINVSGAVSAATVNVSGAATAGNIIITGTATAGNIVTTGTATTGAVDVIESVTLQASRATTPVLNGGDLGQLFFQGYNGTIMRKGVLFSASVASTVTGGVFAADATLSVANSDAGYRSFVFKNTGVFETAATKLIALTTQQITAGVTPSIGLITYNSDVSSLQLYTGAAWNTITRFVAVPASKTATGLAGAIAADANYFYVCFSTNNWIRIAKDGTW